MKIKSQINTTLNGDPFGSNKIETYIGSHPCKSHKIAKRGYIEWHKWAKKHEDKGIQQSQCPDCGYWLYPEEI